MIEEVNLHIIKMFYAAFRRNDLASMLDAIDDNVEWFALGPVGLIPTAGLWRGRDGVCQFFATLKQVEEMPNVLSAGIHRRSRNGGRHRESRTACEAADNGNTLWVHVFTFSRARIVRSAPSSDTAAVGVRLQRCDPAVDTCPRSEEADATRKG